MVIGAWATYGRWFDADNGMVLGHVLPSAPRPDRGTIDAHASTSGDPVLPIQLFWQ
jgi:hypothetical protein